jgi:PAT family beta-lactamase induction signal transducer AmpG
LLAWPIQVKVAIVITADNLSAGIAGSAFIAYLSSLTNTAYTATQYALFSSLMTLFPKIISGFSGMIVDHTSYIFFFIYASTLGVPVIIMVIWLMNKTRKTE